LFWCKKKGKKLNSVQKGIYTLIITLKTPSLISVGKLGIVFFPQGYYAYVGSALNGLPSRIARHLQKEKSLHWHIDYFLKKGIVQEIIYSITSQNRECVVAFQLNESLISVPRFGCSDCRCESHLFHCHNRYSLRKIIRNSFKKNGLVPRVWE